MSIEQFLPPKTQKQYPRVLDVALFTTTIIYAFFGFFGYLFFKNRTQGIIFSNLQCYKAPLDWCNTLPDNCHDDTWAPICTSRISYTSAQILSKMVKAAMACMITFNCKFRYRSVFADPFLSCLC